MTEEQIKQKSKDYAEKNNDVIHPHKLALERAYSTGLRVGITEVTKELEEKIKDFEGQITRAFEVLKGKRKRIAELEAQIEKTKCYLPVDKRDSDHKWFAYKNLFDTEWKIDYSVQGALPKCNTIKWFENKEAVMFYLVSNGMKYYEEPRR